MPVAPDGEGAGGQPKKAVEPAVYSGGKDKSSAEQQEAPKEQHKFPYYKDIHNSETPGNFLKKYPEQGKLADDLVEKTKDKLPKQENESDIDYQTRAYNELKRRLKFQGDYVGAQDELFTMVQNHPDMDKPWYTLMAVEAKHAQYLQTENQRLEEDTKNRLGRIFRRDVKTEVTHEGEPSYIEGDYEHYFDEQQRPKELPKTDLYAFTLVADQFLDITDPAVQKAGETKTYRQQMKELEDGARDTRKLISLRSQFYSMTIEAIRTVDQLQYVNPDEATQTPKDKVLTQMHDKLKEIRGSSIDDLVDKYQGVGGGMSEKHKGEMRRLLSERKPQLLEFALKGADLIQRRISYSPKLHEVLDKIHYKKFVQGGDGDGDGDGEQPRILTTSSVKKPEEGEGESEEKLPPAPTTEKEEEEEKPSVPQAPVPAPVPEEPPPSELILGAAALYDRRVQNVYQLADHSFAHDLQRMPVPRIARIPLFGPVLWGIRHPIKLVWQNGLARTVFKQQHIRFVSDMEDIAKQTSDRSVPVEITPQLIDKALDQGRQERRQQRFWKRAAWSVSDYAKGLTGIGQTSEQIFARRWLTDQAQKQPDQRDATLQSVTQRTMQEQTELGQRYARLPEGMTVGQANRLVLAQDAGETRHDLPENLQAEANRRVKAILERYANPNAQNRFTADEALVTAVNQYLLSDFRNSLPPDLQKEFSAPEVASNIVNLARTVRDNWQRYQEQETANGQTRWENLQIKVLFGKGEWGGVRGKAKEGFLTERLTRRLAERRSLRGEGILAGAVALAQDAATYGGAYTGGWLLSGAAFGSSSLARAAGGVGGTALVSYIKEAGIDLSRFGRAGFKGRYQKEVEQHSREMARGRGIPQTARIRQEVNPVLVDRIIASTTAEQLQQRIDSPDLSEQQARQLLADLAQLDAKMRLTDMSGGRKLNFKTQNYIQFTEGAENEEYNRLRGALLNGIEKLQAYSDANKQFLNGQQQMEVFDKYSALAEAQLRVTSTDAQVRQWLGREGGFNQQEVDNMMQEIFPNMNMAVQKEQSLQRKEQILANLRFRRGVAMAGRTIVGGAVATGVYGIPVSEGIELVKEGPVQYAQDWAKVLKGEIPIHPNASGQLEADLTPLQHGILWAEQKANLVSLPGGGDVRIDGIVMKLEPGVTYDQANDVLIDTRNGKIVDMREFRLVGRAGAIDVFAERDLNGDGTIDNADHQEAIRLFNQRTSDVGITFVTGPEQTKTVDLLTPTGTKEDMFVGQKTTIPTGTHWVKDGNKYDLVIDQYPTKVLINDASFDADGRMQAAFIDPALKSAEIGGVGGVVTGPEAAAEWANQGTRIDHREWYSYNLPGSQGNELRLYDRHEGDAVVLDMSKMREGYQTGLNPEHVNVQTDVIQKGNAVMAFSIPGHVGEPILVKVPTGELRLDPTDTDPTHKIEFYNGKSMQAGEFAKMVVNQEELTKLPQGDIATELYGRQKVFNLSFEGRNGFIEAGTVAEQDGKLVFQSFATIQGSGQVQVGGGGALGITPVFELTEKITDTVTVPTFVVHPGTLQAPDIGGNITFIPFPVRQNIEKSGPPGIPTEQGPYQQTTPRQPVPTPTPQPAPITEEERRKREEDEQIRQQVVEIDNRLRELERAEQSGQQLTPEEKQERERLRGQRQQLEQTMNVGEYQPLQTTVEATVAAPAEAAMLGVTIESVDSVAADLLLNRTAVHGSDYQSEKLTAATLAREGLTPKHKIKVDNVEMWVSQAYNLGGGRIAVVGYVKDVNGTIIARSFYRSNSQAAWRYLPQYRVDEQENVDWYGKGWGEESVMLSFGLQQALAEISKDPSGVKTVQNPELMFVGTARKIDQSATFGRTTESEPKRLEGNFFPSGIEKTPPEQLTFTNPDQQPDFGKRLASWKLNTDLYSEITVDIYPSIDSQYQYMFCRDSRGRAWIGGIDNTSEIQSTGVRKSWIDAGDLTTPAYEYKYKRKKVVNGKEEEEDVDYTGGYGNDSDRKNNVYSDMFQNYLSKVPVIKEYLQTIGP